MKNVTKALRKKYYELLSPVLNVNGNPVPVYNKYLPSTVDQPYYVIIRSASNTDSSTMQSNNTNTTIQLGIYTKDFSANDETACDTIGDQIYATIYPTPQSTIDLMPDFQVAVFKLESDTSPDALQTGESIYINRFITFFHKVLHKPLSEVTFI